MKSWNEYVSESKWYKKLAKKSHAEKFVDSDDRSQGSYWFSLKSDPSIDFRYNPKTKQVHIVGDNNNQFIGNANNEDDAIMLAVNSGYAE